MSAGSFLKLWTLLKIRRRPTSLFWGLCELNFELALVMCECAQHWLRGDFMTAETWPQLNLGFLARSTIFSKHGHFWPQKN